MHTRNRVIRTSRTHTCAHIHTRAHTREHIHTHTHTHTDLDDSRCERKVKKGRHLAQHQLRRLEDIFVPAAASME